MHVVIDIDEKLNEYIKQLDITGDTSLADLGRAIQRGTPLPKGHGRLIDAKELDNAFWDNHSKLHQYCDITSTINLASTIIEADEEE